ncbi:MAG: two-CW domain-containing protein [Thermoplasmatota archaeon]
MDGDTSSKKNCWQFNDCGKEPFSERIHDMNECPVLKAEKFDGINSGINGGRYCWRVEGVNCAACGGISTPNWSDAERNCLLCDFFNKVRKEEGSDFTM